MKTQRFVIVISIVLICTLPISVFALDEAEATVTIEQVKDQPATNEMETTLVWQPGFVANRVYQAAGPVYAIAGGEFDLGHDGMEIACLTSDGSMLQLSPNFLVWEASIRYEGRVPVEAISTRPTIGIGDIHSGYPGGEVVIFNRHPSVVTVVFHDPNAGWSHEVLADNSEMTGNGWGARVGDYDPYRPGDEVFYIYESAMDSSIGMLFSEVAGTWEKKGIYGWESWMEVGMDSAAGDFNWEHTGPEIVITTEMGPTYEIVAPVDVNEGDWPIRTVWDNPVNAGWVTKIADVDPWSPGDEIVYGTRFNNRIMISRQNKDGVHDLQILLIGNATEHPRNMWDIAIGDVLLQSPGLEILGVDSTGSVYLLQRIGETWQGQVIWQDTRPLYAVTVGDFLPHLSGDEILVAGRSGTITLLKPTFRGSLIGNVKPGL
ncbi:MAG: hypothetical protein FVQ84_07370 [Planctomycetes bacterium]|nr:hypothetical protein [Planctomycetota bacterium]